jgi:hypothetical protein
LAGKWWILLGSFAVQFVKDTWRYDKPKVVQLRRQTIVYLEIDIDILRNSPALKCTPESLKSPRHSSFIEDLTFFRRYEPGLRNYRNEGPEDAISDANLISVAVQWPPSRAKDRVVTID